MRAPLHRLVLAAAVSAAASSAHAQSLAPARTASASPAHQQTLADYCVGCHSDRVRTAGLSLERADLYSVAAHPELWEKVARKLRLGVMPPQGARRPDRAVLDAVAASLEADLDAAAAARPNPGRPALHRLNRAEYANAVRDLLGLDVDVAALLPPDTAAFGFDNVADALGSSPALLQAYLSAARKILLAGGADPALLQENGNTPLLLAAGLGFRGPIGGTEAMALDAIAFSLARGADVNAVNAAGDTAVHVAATTNFNESGTSAGSLAVVKFLVERGARLDVRNKQGRTALESVLRAKEHSATIEAFLRERSPAPTPQ